MKEQKFEIIVAYEEKSTEPWTEEQMEVVFQGNTFPSLTKIISVKEIK